MIHPALTADRQWGQIAEAAGMDVLVIRHVRSHTNKWYFRKNRSFGAQTQPQEEHLCEF